MNKHNTIRSLTESLAVKSILNIPIFKVAGDIGYYKSESYLPSKV